MNAPYHVSSVTGGDAKESSNAGRAVAERRQPLNLGRLVGLQLRTGAITRLLISVSPAAVARLVVTIVVDAVERATIRLLSHVSEEVLERHPALADRDSAAAVSAPMRLPWIRASRDHCAPHCMRRRSSIAIRMTMSALETATRWCSCLHLSRGPGHNGSAIAPKQPDRLPVVAFIGQLNRGQHPEPFAGQVTHAWIHCPIIRTHRQCATNRG